MTSNPPRRCVPRDAPYYFDVSVAEQGWQRHDGGTVSDRVSEELGVSKTGLHVGAVGTTAGAAFVGLFAATQNPWARLFGGLAIAYGARALFRYLEAPRCK